MDRNINFTVRLQNILRREGGATIPNMTRILRDVDNGVYPRCWAPWLTLELMAFLRYHLRGL